LAWSRLLTQRLDRRTPLFKRLVSANHQTQPMASSSMVKTTAQKTSEIESLPVTTCRQRKKFKTSSSPVLNTSRKYWSG
jgi:hypothetical protein